MFRIPILFVLRNLLRLRYRIEVKGLDKITHHDGVGMLFLPNHPALIDPLIVNVVLQKRFAVRPLADRGQAQNPVTGFLLNYINALLIPDLHQQCGLEECGDITEVLRLMEQSLKQGEHLLVYPAGRIYRGPNEDVGGCSAVERLVKAVPEARIVLVRTSGLWGSRFSRAYGEHPRLFNVVLRMVPKLLLNGLFFMPKRKVSLEFFEDPHFPRQDSRQEINTYLENFYNEGAQAAFSVPDYFWQGTRINELPPLPQMQFSSDASHVPAGIREEVEDKLRELGGHTRIRDDMTLAYHLGLDSLAVMEFLTWLNEEFSVDVEQLDALQQVSDCLLAACGEGPAFAAQPLKPVEGSWFEQRSDNKLTFRTADNLAELILSQAKKNPAQVIVADQHSGTKTWRQLLTRVLALQPLLRDMQEESVGIMLPASVAACVCWLGVVFSGKRPVLLNWTVGEHYMARALEQSGVKRVLTSSALMDKLRKRGIDMDNMEAEWLPLEHLAAQMRFKDKISARLKGQFFHSFLKSENVNDTAAVLFTSGSEGRPKSVPLSHRNILTNLDDMTRVIPLQENDRLLGMLPPFHSLGLSCTIVMPLCIGLRSVYYPNPTDGAKLAQHVEAYLCSVLVGTPTFLAAIGAAAQEQQLLSLRMIFTGAEKCPESTYNLLARRCPQATICEGYGVTECAPLVSVNPPQNPVRGTIGQVMPSMEYKLLHPETLQPLSKDEPGLLVVRGPNVFNGYLEDDVKSPFMRLDDNEWYNTGDLVRRNEHGGLTFCGRLQRFVNLGGEMISLPAVEETLAAALELDDISLNGAGPSIAVEAKNPDTHPELVLFSCVPLERERVNSLIRAAGLSPLHHIRQVRQVDEMPVLGTGKVDYRALRKMLA